MENSALQKAMTVAHDVTRGGVGMATDGSICFAQRPPPSDDDSTQSRHPYRKEAFTIGHAPTCRRAAGPYWTQGLGRSVNSTSGPYETRAATTERTGHSAPQDGWPYSEKATMA